MKPSVKKKWLAALRSGEYRKARERLHNKTQKTYCCLGVLRDLDGGSPDDTNGTLGPTTRCRVGMTSDQQTALIQLNDTSRGWDKVCDYIEANL